jgi:hypothetical protein
VIGAGAAGLCAALFAARATGVGTVTLFEKNRRPGLKILISGGGRCNLTTTRSGRELEAEYGLRRGRWLRHALRAFPPRALIELIEAAGVPLHEEDLDKIFPVSGRAADILAALLRLVADAGVACVHDAALAGIRPREDGRFDLEFQGAPPTPGSCIADRVVLATGGLSYPKTGTTGDGYALCRALGHRVIDPVPALAPLAVDAAWVGELAGITIPDLALTLLAADGASLRRRRRPVLFTHKGLSGPGAMDLAGDVEERAAPCTLRLDFAPDLPDHELAAALEDAGRSSGRRLVVNCLPRHIPERVRQHLCRAAGAGGPVAALRRDVRARLVRAVKSTELVVGRSLGFKHAEVTRGGIPLDEVDARTMESKLIANLYLCGEILDVDGPIGGFNFQAAFATGRLAGLGAASASRPGQ